MAYESESLNLVRPFLNTWVTVTIDRPLGSLHPKHDFLYRLNYGFIAGTVAPDGEALDAYVLGINKPVETFQGVCTAIIHRLADDDDKLVVVPEGFELSDKAILEQVEFQEQFFKSDIFCK